MAKEQISAAKIILVLILLVSLGTVMGVAGYLVKDKTAKISQPQISPMPMLSAKDETGVWQTYKNEQYGFEVKYPNNYKIIASPELNEYQKSQGITYLVYSKRSDVNASISVLLTNINFNLQNIQRFAPTGNESLPEQVMSEQNTFYFYGPGGGGVSYPDNYFYNLNGKILVISFDGPYINDKTPADETKQLESQILSTFKFTGIDETADWKTYKNEEYGFEIKYPDSWNLAEESSKMGDSYKVDFVSSNTIKNNTKKVVTISVFENNKNYLVEEWLKDYRDILDNVNGVGLIFEKEFSVNREKGLKGGFGCCGSYREAFFVAKGNYVYAVQGGYMDFDIKPLGSFYDYSEDFDEILSTFKITGKIEAGKTFFSYANVYFSKDVQGMVYLRSQDVKSEETKSIFCGAPVAGKKEYEGNFSLNFKESSLNLGRLFFAEDTVHNGTLSLKKLNPNGDQDFIVIFQNGSCNFEMARFYGYNFRFAGLMQYKFKRIDGGMQNEIYTGPDGKIDILPSRDFISSAYDNTIGKFRVTQWRFNPDKAMFEEVKSWLKDA